MTEPEILKSLERIEHLLRLILKSNLHEILAAEVSDPQRAIVFDLTGEKSREEIVAASKLSAGTVSGLWQRWEALGLVEREGKGYRRTI